MSWSADLQLEVLGAFADRSRSAVNQARLEAWRAWHREREHERARARRQRDKLVIRAIRARAPKWNPPRVGRSPELELHAARCAGGRRR